MRLSASSERRRSTSGPSRGSSADSLVDSTSSCSSLARRFYANTGCVFLDGAAITFGERVVLAPGASSPALTSSSRRALLLTEVSSPRRRAHLLRHTFGRGRGASGGVRPGLPGHGRRRRLDRRRRKDPRRDGHWRRCVWSLHAPSSRDHEADVKFVSSRVHCRCRRRGASPGLSSLFLLGLSFLALSLNLPFSLIVYRSKAPSRPTASLPASPLGSSARSSRRRRSTARRARASPSPTTSGCGARCEAWRGGRRYRSTERARRSETWNEGMLLSRCTSRRGRRCKLPPDYERAC